MTVSLGADPEFFLYNYGADNDDQYDEDGEYIGDTAPRYVPSVGLVPGTKSEPQQLGDGYFCHEDNVAVEVGIPVSQDGATFAFHVAEAMKRVTAKYLEPLRYELMCSPSIQFHASQLQSEQAQAFGCEPDYNAYTNGEMRKIPDTFGADGRRYAGGHIHLGGDFNCPPFVAALFADLYLQLPWLCSTSLPIYTADWVHRAKHYGQPGIFRTKPYGIEYRTPSNWWCANPANSRSIGQSAYRLCRLLEDTNATDLRTMVRTIPWNDVQEFLSEPPANHAERSDKAGMLCNDISESAGLAL